MRNCKYLAIVAVPLGLAASTLVPVSSVAQEPTVVVSVEDIGTKVALVGRLGQPLGTIMDVKGTWRHPDARVKDDSVRFIVSHVNGKPLKKLVEFNVAQVEAVSKSGESAMPNYDEHKILEGVAWTLRAYETGRYDDIPEDYYKESGTGVRARPYWTDTFTSKLVGVVQKRPPVPR